MIRGPGRKLLEGERPWEAGQWASGACTGRRGATGSENQSSRGGTEGWFGGEDGPAKQARSVREGDAVGSKWQRGDALCGREASGRGRPRHGPSAGREEERGRGELGWAGLEALREWAGAEKGLGPCGRRMGWAVGVLGPGLVSLLGLDSFSNFFSYF